eukprot:gene33952-41088_t
MDSCCRCRGGKAQWRCLECDSNSSLFCSDCHIEHSRSLGGFQKGHKLIKISKSIPQCKNCGEAESKFLCRDCGLEDGFFCLGCSVFHSKVKQFKGHVVAPISNGSSKQRPSSSAADLKSALGEFVQNHVDVVLAGPGGGADFYYSVATLCAALLGYYALVKTLFKDYALIANAVVILLLVRMYNPQFFAASLSSGRSGRDRDDRGGDSADRGREARAAPNKHVSFSKSGVRAADVASLSAAFPDEFPYPLEGRRAPLRPRTRPYRGRPRGDRSRVPEGGADGRAELD